MGMPAMSHLYKELRASSNCRTRQLVGYLRHGHTLRPHHDISHWVIGQLTYRA